MLPPTLRIANEKFGESEGPVVHGWIQVAHQFGAATAAFGAGLMSEITGEYNLAFVAAGAAALLTL